MLVDIILELEKFAQSRNEEWTNGSGQKIRIEYKLNGEFKYIREEKWSRLIYQGTFAYVQNGGGGKTKFSPTKNGLEIVNEFVRKIENLTEQKHYIGKYNRDEDAFEIRCSEKANIESEKRNIQERLGQPSAELWKLQI